MRSSDADDWGLNWNCRSSRLDPCSSPRTTPLILVEYGCPLSSYREGQMAHGQRAKATDLGLGLGATVQVCPSI